MTSHSNSGVVLVTGASRGIGAAVARRLARDGLAVAINSHPDGSMVAAAESVAADIRDAGGSASVFPADISKAASVDRMFGDCESQLGRVETLVLNAAAVARHPWTEITETEWDRISDVNLKGAFLCCRRAFATQSPTTSGGSIVTISSILANVGATDRLHYATTKAGIIGFTRSLARELGARGVRVNCVMPGAIRTDEELEAYPDQDDATRVVLSRQALQRRGVAEDVAGVVSFLVGLDSAFITGQTICVDGGWSFL